MTTMTIPGNTFRGDVEVSFDPHRFAVETIDRAGYTGRQGLLLRHAPDQTPVALIPDSDDKEFTYYDRPELAVAVANHDDHTCHSLATLRSADRADVDVIFIRFYDRRGLVH